MTKYSIPANTPPETLSNHKADNYLLESDDFLEVDSAAWESRMAQLFGLEAELSPTETEEISEESVEVTPVVSPSPPVEQKTEQSLSANPFAKLGLVGAATLGVVLVAGVFLTQLMGGTNQKPNNNKIVTPQTQPPVTQQPSNLAAQVETLKTKLALTEQAAAVRLAQQQLRNTRPTSSPQTAVPQNSLRQPRRIPTPTPTATVYVPRVVTVERVVRVPYPQPQPIPQPVIPPVASATPQPTPTPSPTPTPTAQKPPEIASSKAPVNNQFEEDNNQAEPQTINPQPEPNLGQVAQQSPKTVPVGSQVKAVLATAIFGETTKSGNSDNKNVFVVRLREPLKSTDGAIALPANTELLAEIRTLSDQGLLQLNVTKVMLSEKGKLAEKSLPENAIAIRAPQGRPLIANQFPNRGSSIASMDVGLFVLGGLGKAAELINRSDSQVVTTTGGSTVVSTNNPQRNLLAGVFEGGMNTVVPQISQRNQQAISQLSQRTNVWFLPAGTNVEIYVNQVMEF